MRLHLLEGNFAKFYEIIDRYYSIEVVSRIEVAKQKVLRDRSQTILELTSLTDQIEKDVETAILDIKESLKKTSETLKTYGYEVDTDRAKVDDFLQAIRDSQLQLCSSKSGLESSINGFSLYSDTFFRLLEQSNESVGRLREEEQQLDRITSLLQDMQSKALKQKKELLKQNGLEKWEAAGGKLEELVSKFTILTHKQLAGDLTGFEIEEGDQEGDLTLF